MPVDNALVTLEELACGVGCSRGGQQANSGACRQAGGAARCAPVTQTHTLVRNRPSAPQRLLIFLLLRLPRCSCCCCFPCCCACRCCWPLCRRRRLHQHWNVPHGMALEVWRKRLRPHLLLAVAACRANAATLHLLLARRAGWAVLLPAQPCLGAGVAGNGGRVILAAAGLGGRGEGVERGLSGGAPRQLRCLCSAKPPQPAASSHPPTSIERSLLSAGSRCTHPNPSSDATLQTLSLECDLDPHTR